MALLRNNDYHKTRKKTVTFLFLNYVVNEGQMPVKDGKVESKVQRNKEQNMNESNNMADVDEQFQINIITTKDVSSMNQNN